MTNNIKETDVTKLVSQLEIMLNNQQKQSARLSQMQRQIHKIEQDIYQEIQDFVSRSIAEILPQNQEGFFTAQNAGAGQGASSLGQDEVVTAVQMDEAMQAVRATMRDIISEQIQLYLRHHNIPSFFS